MKEQEKEFKSIKDISILEIVLSDYIMEMEWLPPLTEDEKEETAEK